MPFLLFSARRALSAIVTLCIALSYAQQQQCYYPDSTPSPDIPCGNSGDSSCCPSTSWCMDNGLCFAGGLVSRGSCTDQNWKSKACTKFCRKVSPSGSIAVTPCGADGTFSCGYNSCDNSDTTFSMSGSGSMVLRASQVQALVAPAIAAAEGNHSSACAPGATNNGTAVFTAGQLAGVGCALGVPLLIAIIAIVFLLYSRRNQPTEPPPPDPSADIRLQPPMRITHHPSYRSTSYDGSEHGSTFSRSSMSDHAEHTRHTRQWSRDRYRSINEKIAQPVRIREIRVELDASQEVRPPRHELGTPTRNEFGSLNRHELGTPPPRSPR